MYTLELDELVQVQGGVAPLVIAAVSTLSSTSAMNTLALLGAAAFAMDLAADILE